MKFAVSVIGVVYSDDLSMAALLVAAACLAVLVGLDRAGVWQAAPYVLVVLVLWIATVESGGAAATAGIKEGDVILRIGERDIRTMSDYMEAARGLQPGDKAIVKLRRADQELDLEVTFKGRGDPDQNEKK